MTKSNKIKAFSLARFQAILFAPIGLLAGISYSFGGVIYDLLTIGLNTGTALAFMALIGMPVIFAVFGYVLGLLEALLYNFFTRRYSVISIDLNL